MSIKEIIDKESTATDRIFLHKEGLFWKLYERSAFWFVHNVHPFKATKRFVKSVGQEVVTIGFPVIAFEKYAANLKVISKAEKIITLEALHSQQADESFKAWKESQPLTIDAERQNGL